MSETLLSLTLYLTLLSLFAVGGLNGMLPELHRILVDKEGWLTTQQFSELFALCQAAPGPNSIFISVLGFEIGGLIGALVTTVAFTLPAFFIAYLMMRVWVVSGEQRWFVVIRKGLTPITVGLIVSSAWFIAETTAVDPTNVIVTCVAVFLISRYRTSPAALICVAGIFGGSYELFLSL